MEASRKRLMTLKIGEPVPIFFHASPSFLPSRASASRAAKALRGHMVAAASCCSEAAMVLQVLEVPEEAGGDAPGYDHLRSVAGCLGRRGSASYWVHAVEDLRSAGLPGVPA
jgi:hypothetical protein